MNNRSLQNNQLLRSLLRCAMMMAILLPMTLWGQITPTTDTNGNGTIEDNEKNLYLIQTQQFESFYITPKDGSNLNTMNLPHASMLWYFLEAEYDAVNDIQYYYIVNNNTGEYVYNTNYTLNDDNGRLIKLGAFDPDDNTKGFKFYLIKYGTTDYYYIYTKQNERQWLGLNKQRGNAEHSNGIRLTNNEYINNINSRWKFIPYNGSLNWPNPTFTPSTDSEKYYYKIRNKKENSYYVSTNSSTNKVTYSSTASNDMAWYVKEAPSSGLMKYYYIINPAADDKYMYYDGTATNGSNQSDAVSIKDINDANADPDRFLFVIVQAAVVGSNDTPINGYYMIVPKLLIGNLWSSNSLGNNSPSNGSNMGIIPGRGADVYSHWSFESTDYVAIAAPTITNNFDGTISLSTSTPDAKIYYTTDGTTPSSSNGTLYTSDPNDYFPLGTATVIKAITYNSDLTESSAVTTYDVPKYSTPTISFDENTSEITITCTGATGIYYTTDGGTPTTQYSAPFTVSSDVTIKAIATHAGYLNSDVATWSNAQHDYSQDYLTFKILTGGTIGWKAYGNLTRTIEYSINNGDWTTWTSTSSGATITVQAGNLVRLRGTAYPYATSKSAYSGFEGGTATYDIEGNIHSLIYGDDFAGTTTMPNNTYMFCSLFKKSNAISAKNLILPATSLKSYCYRALFSYATSLEKPCALPATTLATGCYWYMFEQCAITTAPELNATALVKECYGNMFNGCSNLKYIKCLATTGFNLSDCLTNWVSDVSSTGTFVKDANTTTWTEGSNGIPTNWIVANEGVILVDAPVITCDGEHVTITCATTGADIYYRLGTSGTYSQYTTPITINANTTVQAYGVLNGQVSITTTQYCEYVSSVPIEESNRSLKTWTFNGDVITTPYSVNAIDGHSSSYAKGTFTFETSFTLRSVQPTYLWFQHADQSAAVYIDNTLVEKHWGGYNAFFVDISSHVHSGTNNLKVALKNNEGNSLAPAAGDFNFNATLGNVKLFTSPVLPSMDYGYDGFHITSSVTAASATINIKTSIPVGASVICKIDADDEDYHFRDTLPSTGEEMTFTTTISNPHLWNGIEDPFLYNVTLEIYYNNELYHRYERPYGFRYYEYVINEPIGDENYTGFMLNGSPCLLRGVCMHHDLEGKANALDDDDIANDFAIIKELGCNFVRLAHYPHPKEVYDWCDSLGIIVQTEVPCVNKFQNTLPQDYYDHLYIQYEDMVRQHYNHPCIMFWGLFNEATTDDTSIAKTRLEAYRTYIKNIDPERWVGYVVSHSYSNPSNVMGNPDLDWFGCNIYVGWYINKDTNDPTSELNKRVTSTITNLSKPLAFSEYGCGGTPNCHSDDFKTTTTTGNNPRHDIEYQMWLHEGHIASIKNFPQLLFTSQWQLFDIAVSSRQEGYTICLDGENTLINDDLKYLNNKGLVERDHKTKKDPFYLYKAWWNQTDLFVHICGKDYKKLTNREIKCYTNDGGTLSLYVNDEFIQTVTVTNNIAKFTARDFNPGDVIRVDGDHSNDTFTFTNYNNNNVFITEGNWNVAANWSGKAVPADGNDVVIMANTTVPSGYTAHAGNIDLFHGSLTIADGGQLVSNSAVNATVEKNITAYTIPQNQGESLANGWYFIASPITDGYTPTGSMVANTYDLYRLDPSTTTWENYKNSEHSDFTSLVNGQGYLYANSNNVTLSFTGAIKPYDATCTMGGTGWNLVGNPYTFNAYVNQSHYILNDTRDAIVAATSNSAVIAPCTGVIVEGNATFYNEAVSQSHNNGHIQLAVAQQATNRGTATTFDNAIVSFNKGDQLGKFYFGTQNANIYIPQGAEEYAIVSAQAQGEIPVNFKANENGSYTITVNAEDVEMGYLHLIDNKTGNDVDLLQTPSYTFEAKTMDYASRFRLVFDANGNNASGTEIFAFIHNGEIVINGKGTVQVVDVMGRILISTDETRTVSTAGMAPGIYVIRLIQGDNVRIQKIVI